MRTLGSQDVKSYLRETFTTYKLTEAEWSIHAYVNQTFSGSDNGLSPGRRQAIIWTNAASLSFNALRPRRNGRHFQTTFSNAFSWMEILEFSLKFHWNLFLVVQNNNIPSLVQIMAWRRPSNKPLSETTMGSLMTHICVTRPQWVKPKGTYFSETVFKTQKFSLTKITVKDVCEMANVLSRNYELENPDYETHKSLTKRYTNHYYESASYNYDIRKSLIRFSNHNHELGSVDYDICIVIIRYISRNFNFLMRYYVIR